MIGTRGLPPKYGGFETALSEIAPRLAQKGAHVTVYCRNKGQRLKYWRGVRLRNVLCVRNKALETITHSGFSTIFSLFGGRQVTLLFGAGSAMLIPFLKLKGPVILHLGGLDWDRAKWSGPIKKALRWSESFGVKAADAVIVDSLALKRVVDTVHSIDSKHVSYGTPSMKGRPIGLEQFGLVPGGYLLIVSRFEPENHVVELIEGYLAAQTSRPLIVVGAAPYNPSYTRKITKLAERGDVRLLGRIDDEALLHSLYVGAYAYLHGHSVGGTNPSLLRALAARTPIIAWENDFNWETTGGFAQFVRSPEEVALAVGQIELDSAEAHADSARGARYAACLFDWESVTKEYLLLIGLEPADSAAVTAYRRPRGLVPASSLSGATPRASAMAQTLSRAGE